MNSEKKFEIPGALFCDKDSGYYVEKGYYAQFCEEREFWITKALLLKLRSSKDFADITKGNYFISYDMFRLVGIECSTTAERMYFSKNWRSLQYAIEELHKEACDEQARR